MNRLPSPAFVLAFVALFVGLGGGAFAATQIGGKQIKNASITGTDIKNHSLTAKDFKGSVRGPRGRTGAKGATGAAGARGPAAPAVPLKATYVWRAVIVPAMSTGGEGADCPRGQVVIGGGPAAHEPGLVMLASYPSYISDGFGEWSVQMQNSTASPIQTAVYAICVPGTSSFPNGVPPAS